MDSRRNLAFSLRSSEQLLSAECRAYLFQHPNLGRPNARFGSVALISRHLRTTEWRLRWGRRIALERVLGDGPMTELPTFRGEHPGSLQIT